MRDVEPICVYLQVLFNATPQIGRPQYYSQVHFYRLF